MKRCAQFVLLISSFSLIASLGFSRGTERQGGGDALNCRASETGENSYNGLYFLDYFLTVDSGTESQLNMEAATWKASIQRIQLRLNELFPKLGQHFKGYLDLLNNGDLSQNRVWKGKKLPLIDIKDENYPVVIPQNCFEKNGSREDIYQAVIRKEYETGFIRYTYNTDVLQKLEEEAVNQFQYSFLLVHEWLWDFFPVDRIELLRDANFLLHSKNFDTQPVERIKMSLLNLGIPETYFDSTGSNPDGEKEFLELSSGFACFAKGTNKTCWGYPYASEEVDNLNIDDEISGIGVGKKYACFISDEKIKCAGYESYDSGWNTRILDSIRYPTALFASPNFNCVLTKYDGLQCFYNGRSTSGEPVVLPNLTDPYDAVFANYFGCAFTKYGLKCFGEIPFGAPRDIENFDVDNLIGVDSGGNTICGLYKSKVDCIGYDSKKYEENQPVLVNPREISVGDSHICVIDNDEVKCWGGSGVLEEGQLEVPVLRYPKYIRSHGNTTCARDEIGIRCWGTSYGYNNLLNVPHNLYPMN